MLVRSRLLELSSQISNHKLTVLQASAGFGKTSLMCQWYQLLKEGPDAVAWLSVDSVGLSAVDLLAYVGSAIAGVIPEIEQTIDAVVQSRRHQTEDTMATALVNLLVEADKRVVLFIDDLHFLSDETVAQLARFIEISPRDFHIVVASRAYIGLGLAAARARGQLLKVGMEELRFTAEETKAYIESAGWRDSGADAVSLLERRTDGWITGIKLASLAYRNEEAGHQSLLNYSGSHYDVSDFFAEQVLSTQGDEVKNFLLKTSMLNRFSAELCDYVLQSDRSREVLDEIESAGLFLIGLDRERQWYRYHPLFRDFLTRQLRDAGTGEELELHLRSAEWFRGRGMLVEAIEVLLRAGQADKAAQILETCSQDWTYKGRISLVTQYIARLPREVLERYPTILLTWVWHLIRHLNFEEGRTILDKVRLLMEDEQRQGVVDQAGFNALRYQLLHREMTLAAAQDDTPLVESKCLELLAAPEGELHPYLKGSAYSQLLYAQRDQFQMKELEVLAAKARGVLDRSGYDFALIAVLAVIGTSLYSIGKVEAAKQAAEQGMVVAARYGGDRSALVALAGLPLSAMLYESNETKRAEEILARQLANATDWGLVDQFVAGYVTQVRILILHGEEEEALQVLDEGMALALDRNLERLRLSLVAEQLRILSVSPTASKNKIVQYGRSADIPVEAESVMANAKSRSVDESRAIAWFRVAMASDDLLNAVHVAKSWRRFSEVRGAQLSHVRWGILLAQAQLQSGDARSAQRVLREAIAVAAPMGVCRSFLDEGQSIYALVENCCQVKSGSTHPTDLYAIQLLEAFGGKLGGKAIDEQDVVYSSLGDREIEVLLQVSLGMRNREVAERLGMTEGSIKWYMQQIFDKLGTRSRLQAVERARKLGLIS